MLRVMDIKPDTSICIKVIGVGGVGVCVINRIIQTDAGDIEVIAVDTDQQTLSTSGAATQIKLREAVPAGQDELDYMANEESRGSVVNALNGADIVLIAAGMGGCTSTSAAPTIAGIAKELGILTVGIVTKPFAFEDGSRILRAEKGIAAMLAKVDSLVVIANEQLKHVSRTRTSTANVFDLAADELCQTVQSLLNLLQSILKRSDISEQLNLDFNSVIAVMENTGMAYLGMGRAMGECDVETAMKMAISNPVLETTLDGSKGILVNITGSQNLTLKNVNAALNMLKQDSFFIINVALDKVSKDGVCVTVFSGG